MSLMSNSYGNRYKTIKVEYMTVDLDEYNLEDLVDLLDDVCMLKKELEDRIGKMKEVE
jgi:hypothetical protein